MTVLVACNDSAHGSAALAAGIKEAHRRGEGLAVLFLNPGTTPPPSSQELLATLPAGMGEPRIVFRTENTEPSDAILDLADEVEASLVVIGAAKRAGQGRFVMGITTQRVLLDAPAPVLVVKACYDTPA